MSKHKHFSTRRRIVDTERVGLLRCFCDCRRLFRKRPRNAARRCLLIQHLQPRFACGLLEAVVLIDKLLCFARGQVIAIVRGLLHRLRYGLLLAPHLVLRGVELGVSGLELVDSSFRAGCVNRELNGCIVVAYAHEPPFLLSAASTTSFARSTARCFTASNAGRTKACAGIFEVPFSSHPARARRETLLRRGPFGRVSPTNRARYVAIFPATLSS
ncbi:Uncharacterised protein [Burkholderia pseudomallei]|nr:Uncharacterised protein [Burkholderia pseudomallei]